MTQKGFCVVLGLGLLAAPAITITVSAHHSFAATFDVNKPVTVKAVITEVRWENPHTLMYVDVKDESGNVTKWTFESYPPSVLYRKGLRQNRLKPGAEVTLTGHVAKSVANWAEVSIVAFPDGESFCVPASGSTSLCDANER
jgi:DNA/RNA endonuclease YhcR with UshA esterase domain